MALVATTGGAGADKLHTGLVGHLTHGGYARHGRRGGEHGDPWARVDVADERLPDCVLPAALPSRRAAK